MDLSHRGQSRDAEGRHPAARPGLGPRVGARVASPRCPILRPGSCSVSGTTATGQCRGWISGAHDGQEALAGTAGQDQENVPGPSPRGGSSTRCGVGHVSLQSHHIGKYIK
jgi:hypothetical protein